jgi:SagB-type dehydrogenase family enzyme
MLTGLLVDNLDLNQFAPHRWAAYILAGLVVVHVAMHWRFFLPARTPRGAAEEHPARSETTEQPVTSGVTRRTAIASAGAGVLGVAAGWFVKGELSPPPYPGGDVGLFYHRASSLGLPSLLKGLVSWGSRPQRYKHVAGPTVALPSDVPLPEMSVGQALAQRRSLRSYRDRSLTAEEVAWVVHAATAITSAAGYRTAPSAGALYPIETYVAVNKVDGVSPGLYHVDVRAQALEIVRPGSIGDDLMLAGLGQEFLRNAPVVLVLTALFQRTRWKYHARHYRYVCWEGGHIAQNIYLAAEAAGLGACMVGAFFDRTLNDLLQIDGRHEAALGLVAVGAR